MEGSEHRALCTALLSLIPGKHKEWLMSLSHYVIMEGWQYWTKCFSMKINLEGKKTTNHEGKLDNFINRGHPPPPSLSVPREGKEREREREREREFKH